jgi:hypothetical protein
MTKLILVCVLTGALGACGGGGADPAAEECNALVDRICGRFAECSFQGVTSKDACIDDFNNNADCDDADQVSATYNDCMTTMQTITCPDLNMLTALPPECVGVILFEP